MKLLASAVHVICTGLGIVLMCFGVIGLFESVRWAAVRSDRSTNFALGAILLMLGFWLWKVA